MKSLLKLSAFLFLGMAMMPTDADAADIYAMNFAATRPWHGQYQYSNWPTPLAAVVPPNVGLQTNYSWGVSQNLMYPIHHQYMRNMSKPAGIPYGGFRGLPYWPSHTDQFGIYYVRGPW